MYKLNIGCHRGTLTSRDSEVREFETLEEAEASYRQSKEFWQSFGYVVWFAHIEDSDGKRVRDYPGNSSYR